jgi:hypothetical protein
MRSTGLPGALTLMINPSNVITKMVGMKMSIRLKMYVNICYCSGIACINNYFNVLLL